jgi:hypothetical protein
MQLSPQMFRALSAEMLANGTGSNIDERRRAARIDVHSRVPIALLSKGKLLPAVPILVKDISPRGVNILFPEPLEAGQQFTLELSSPRNSITLLCNVMHCRRDESGLHSIGAEFTCVLPADNSKQRVDEQTLKRIQQSVLD